MTPNTNIRLGLGKLHKREVLPFLRVADCPRQDNIV